MTPKPADWAEMHDPSITRRPLASRNTFWAKRIAGALARRGVRPNAISVFSVVCAAFAGVMLLFSRGQEPAMRALLFLLAITGIQARLLCNLFDGMVAVEGGLKTKTGELFNELPDRFADVIIIVCAGYSIEGCNWAVPLGWTAAVGAVITAYVRALGATIGAGQQFCGPMAKPHRMALLTVACALSILEAFLARQQMALQISLVLMLVGIMITIIRRLLRIANALDQK